MKLPITLLSLFLLIILSTSFTPTKSKALDVNKVSIQKKCIDSSLVKNYMKSYEIQVPKGWCSYIYHDYLLISTPYKTDFETFKSDNVQLYILSSDGEDYKSKNIEEALESQISILEGLSLFKPVYFSEYHKEYGKYYLIKNLGIESGKKYIKLDILFNHKGRNYIIHYKALESEFETYLPYAINTISTFKIKD